MTLYFGKKEIMRVMIVFAIMSFTTISNLKAVYSVKFHVKTVLQTIILVWAALKDSYCKTHNVFVHKENMKKCLTLPQLVMSVILNALTVKKMQIIVPNVNILHNYII